MFMCCLHSYADNMVETTESVETTSDFEICRAIYDFCTAHHTNELTSWLKMICPEEKCSMRTLNRCSSERCISCAGAEGNLVVAASSASEPGSCIIDSVRVRAWACVFECRSRSSRCCLVRAFKVIATFTWRACQRVWQLSESDHVLDGAEDTLAMLWTGRIS